MTPDGDALATSRTLDELKAGERGVIVDLQCPPAVARRLMELGLVPGTPIELVRRAPLGDPIEVAVRGVRLSVRRVEAHQIHIANG